MFRVKRLQVYLCVRVHVHVRVCVCVCVCLLVHSFALWFVRACAFVRVYVLRACLNACSQGIEVQHFGIIFRGNG